MDAYDPATVFSSIDHMGRYAYAIRRPQRNGIWRGSPRRFWPASIRKPTAPSSWHRGDR